MNTNTGDRTGSEKNVKKFLLFYKNKQRYPRNASVLIDLLITICSFPGKPSE